eukprot:262903_1
MTKEAINESWTLGTYSGIKEIEIQRQIIAVRLSKMIPNGQLRFIRNIPLSINDNLCQLKQILSKRKNVKYNKQAIYARIDDNDFKEDIKLNDGIKLFDQGLMNEMTVYFKIHDANDKSKGGIRGRKKKRQRENINDEDDTNDGPANKRAKK